MVIISNYCNQNHAIKISDKNIKSYSKLDKKYIVSIGVI